MKKILCILLALSVLAACFTACSKKQEPEIAENLEGLKSGYTGDIKVNKTVKPGKIKIKLGKYTFSIADKQFTYKAFEKNEKLTTGLGKQLMDIYVKDGKFVKCEISDKDEYGNPILTTEYSPNGNPAKIVEKKYDYYGNAVFCAEYDKDGKLTGFSTMEYDKNGNIVKKYIYNPNFTLNSVEVYTYDKQNKPLKTAYYDANGKLTSVKKTKS